MGRIPTLKKPDPISLTVHEVNVKHLFEHCEKSRGESLKVLVMPDTHFPNHDIKSLNIMQAIAKDYGPDVLINIGDFYDFDDISPHEQHKNSILKLSHSIVRGQKYLTSLVESIDTIKCGYFCIGNHEIWLPRMLDRLMPDFDKAAVNLGVGGAFDPMRFCEFDGLFETIEHNHFLRIGHLHFTHGFHTNKYHGNNMLQTCGGNVMYGHTETIQQISENSVYGMRMAFNIGTLRDISKASFMRSRPNKWINGFAMVEFARDGSFTVHQITIVNNQTMFNGKVYGG